MKEGLRRGKNGGLGWREKKGGDDSKMFDVLGVMFCDRKVSQSNKGAKMRKKKGGTGGGYRVGGNGRYIR